jgi:preprotein translocase subunit SecE
MQVFLFLREVRSELEKIVWPTRAETLRLTSLVLILSLIVGIYVGGLDFLFTSIVNSFLK